MRDTITESELVDATLDFISHHQDVSARNAMRNTLARLGITVVPDPIPEPEGDVIVVDKYTACWRKGRNSWIDIACGEHRPWSGLEGPVKIYRLEEKRK